jgi:PKD repeat protein
MKRISLVSVALFCVVVVGFSHAATVVPNEIQQPGTQPGEVSNLETPDKCDNCHGGYDQAVEPAFNWRGSMMANASRDPIFWATLAIAEQDFDGSGDLCIRCHSTGGWYGGHSTPTDGSGLAAGDADGVDCDTCHKMTNTDNSEYLGVMNPPFIANDEETPATGYYGTGMLSLSAGNAKLGPYSDAAAKHQFLQSKFHRDVDFCGSCHDVSNPAVGDLAHNNGAQPTGDPVVASGVLGSPVDGKAAFNNFPYQYGVVERTYSEYSSGLLSETLVSNYANLPADLKAGAIQAAFDSAGGNYADGTARYFSCQTCHVPAVTGVGCNKPGTPLRTDLPLHDMTGGNYWMPDAILYQNTQGTLRLGGGLTALQISAVNAGKLRAQQQLGLAASLSVSGNTLKVTNLTAHKLISGYPEGRRMWLNIKWYDSGSTLLREDGKYDVVASVNGTPVKSIANLDDPNTKIYETHYGMTQEWASQLLALGYSTSLPLSFDRVTGAVDYTLGQLAAQAPGTYHETFHFVLNNTVAKDNRIPPYGMSYEEARKRNALPVPATQYGSPGPGGTYNYWDEIALNPPAGAASATIDLLYQPTSWEYVQFLYLANTLDGSDFLDQEGINLLNAWLNTGMAQPYVMASTIWGGTPPSVRADFSANPTSGLRPLQVAFTNSSTRIYNTCAWTFGDGGTSTSCGDPVHTYAAAGVYTVALTVSGPGGTDTLTRTDYITVYEPVDALFVGSPTSGIAPLLVSFTNSSTGDYTTCTWTFGDGGTSSSCGNPTHTYTAGGVYAVALTVSGPGGMDTLTRTGYIIVYEPVDAGFVGSPTGGAPPLLVTFTNQSSGDYTTCTWTFGDGGTSSDCNNPSHSYTAIGAYTVALTVSGPGGTDTLTRPDYITVAEGLHAAFTGYPTDGIAPLDVSFTNSSTGDYDTCAWEFGDGGSSGDCNNPGHTYTEAGVYTVSLTVSGSEGTDTEVKGDYIQVVAEYKIYLPLTSRNFMGLANGQQVAAHPLTDRSVQPY